MKPCPLQEKCESFRRLMIYGPFAVRGSAGVAVGIAMFAIGMAVGACMVLALRP